MSKLTSSIMRKKKVHYKSSVNSNHQNSEFDVIIIGGGLTGLMTGYYLLKKHANLSVMIVECEDEIGGRVNGTNIGFYAHIYQKYISDLVVELHMEIDYCRKADSKKRVFWTYDGPIEIESSVVASQVHYFVKSLDGLSKKLKFYSYDKNDEESKYFAELSVEEYLKCMVVSSNAQLICKSLIYSTCGVVDLQKVSFLWLLVMYHNSGGFYQRLKLSLINNTKYFIKDGFMKLIDKMKNKIIEEHGVIKYSEPVTLIKMDDFKVFITTTSTTYECNYAVIAVPPPESSKIIIESSNLSDNLLQTINAQLLYHTEQSIYFEASLWSSFWFTKYTGNIITVLDKSINLKMAYDVSRQIKKKNSLAGFIYKNRNEFNGAINIFRAINLSFKSQKAVNYIEYYENNCKSFMNVLKPCSIEFHVNPLLHPHHSSRIHFAASEYAEHCPGTADGAIEAGKRAACLVLHHARPQVLSAMEMAEFIPKKMPIWTEDTRELDWAHNIFLLSNIGIFITILLHNLFFKRN